MGRIQEKSFEGLQKRIRFSGNIFKDLNLLKNGMDLKTLLMPARSQRKRTWFKIDWIIRLMVGILPSR